MPNRLKYNKIKTRISGFDQLLYDGLVVPENKSMVIVVSGADDTEKTPFSLQLVQGIASSIAEYSSSMQIFYYSNYLDKDYLEDLELDMIIASSIQRLISKNLQAKMELKDKMASFFFDTSNNMLLKNAPKGSVDLNNDFSYPDKMICDEALYYSNRTNALHLRKAYGHDHVSTEENAVFARRYDSISDLIENNAENMEEIENMLDIKLMNNIIEDKQIDVSIITSSIRNSLQLKKLHKDNMVGCVNLVNRMSNLIDGSLIQSLFDALRERFKISIVVLRDDVVYPSEDADMIIKMSTTNKNANDYLLHYLSIYKSRYQTVVLGNHQYKRRDIGIEVYPSLHLYCQERRYLQRALIFTHSDVISETYQQFLQKNSDSNIPVTYSDYLKQKETISDGYFNALSPSAMKNFSIHNVLETIFINPIKNVNSPGDTESEVMKIENDFLYGNKGGITAIIGEPNTYKRFITFGSAFSSAYRKEDTLFLLLNKDDKIVRRRLQCPARAFKNCDSSTGYPCRNCYKYMHFMNIKLGCIKPEEFMYYLFRQIETKYHDSEIKRIVIDDLQIVEHCFPFLYKDSLFTSALIDECKERKIALYIMCDKNSSLVDGLRVLADNVVCTSRDSKGRLEIIVERYSGYNAKPSKIFSGMVADPTKLFSCYEIGSRGNRRTIFEIKNTEIGTIERKTMSDFWNKIKP